MQELEDKIVEFAKERDWLQFNTPENLAKSIAIEAGELLECFQWNSNYNKDELKYEKNNSFKLSDGRTIQSAIIDNTYLRREKTFYDNLLTYKNSKKRITEVNNSYFDSYEVNYNPDEIKEKVKILEEKIQQTDFEISKLNSIEFEIS